jgi:phosphate transport system substrate-binding protein
MSRLLKLAAAAFTVAITLASCQQRDRDGRPLDTTTSGEIKVAIDESLRPLMDAELQTFHALYKRASIEPLYLAVAEAIDALLNDSVRVAVVTRHLTEEERAYFEERRLVPRELDVALSAIALVVHKDNPDTLINTKQLQALLEGKITRWSDLGGKNSAGIEIVFDNPNSGLIRQLKDSIARVDALPANTFAVENNAAVIDYVSQNPNALGLIGLEWISDQHDSLSNSFLKRIKVMAVAGDSAHFKPYQAYLALKYYPLARRITMISREARAGLGTGFVSFVASEKGQRIVLKSGLVPVTMPLRVVQVNRSPFEIDR